jgi:hypothetical protein
MDGLCCDAPEEEEDCGYQREFHRDILLAPSEPDCLDCAA